MNTETETLVSVLNDRLADMKPEERVELMEDLMRGYCRVCGYPTPGGLVCHCENDE